MKKLCTVLGIVSALSLVACSPVEVQVVEEVQEERGFRDSTVEHEKLAEEYKEWLVENRDSFEVRETLLVKIDPLPHGRYVENDIWVRMRSYDTEAKDTLVSCDGILLNHDSILSSDEMFREVIGSTNFTRSSRLGLRPQYSSGDLLIGPKQVALPKHMELSDLRYHETQGVRLETVSVKNPLYVPSEFYPIVRDTIICGDVAYNIILNIGDK